MPGNDFSMKRYEPVSTFERETSYCPRYLAWHVLDEARDILRVEIPERYAVRLARRAEVVLPSGALVRLGANAPSSWVRQLLRLC
jgi:hypothetical protein